MTRMISGFWRRFEPRELRRERLIRKWMRLLVEQGDTRRALTWLDRKDGRDEK